MKKISSVLIFALVVIMLFGAIPTSASEPYDTYTYSIDGAPLRSPTAYRAESVVDALGMGIGKVAEVGDLKSAKDVVTDSDGNVYIADTGNNRVVVLDKYYAAKTTVSSYDDEFGNTQTLNGPRGVFVTTKYDEATGAQARFLYVCDTGNFRIIVFKEALDGSFVHDRTIDKPDTPLLTTDAFKPSAIAVDLYGRIFVISEACYEGVIVMSGEGDFTGFIGAQKVTYSLLQMIWRRFQTEEQRAQQATNVSVSYNNITVDEHGFVYVTNNNIDAKKQLAAIKSKSPDFSPVKKLNSAGNEIMKRNGFFDPGGEVAVSNLALSKNSIGVSSIIDVAMGSEGSWSIVDEKRSKIFTYDQNGNLLFAFGDMGTQLGNATQMIGITYHNVDGRNNLLALDINSAGVNLTVYSPTDYCDTIMNALANENNHNYSDSITYWQEVLTRNNNFDLAYIGIGKALYNQGKYEEAMDMLANAYETETYSKAFAEIRKDIIGKWLIVFLIVIIAVVVLLLKFLGWAKKKNKVTSLKVGRKTYVEELIYVFHLWFHPFDGFWDLKHEKRGSVRGGLTIMGITILAFFYQSVGRGYIFNPRDTYSTILVQILAVTVPVLLWCVGNWCLTSLFEGEGSLKDIFVATTYSLAPLPILIVISTILTNVLTVTEGASVSLLVTFGYIWVGILLFFGTLVTHDYSLGKNVLIILCTIVAMLVIMFVAILFSSLVIKMVTFVAGIISEIANRV